MELDSLSTLWDLWEVRRRYILDVNVGFIRIVLVNMNGGTDIQASCVGNVVT